MKRVKKSVSVLLRSAVFAAVSVVFVLSFGVPLVFRYVIGDDAIIAWVSLQAQEQLHSKILVKDATISLTTG
ncbi:MAG: hypothetical protein AABZ44_00305, partial [Elusimicrobiota bacterium]